MAAVLDFAFVVIFISCVSFSKTALISSELFSLNVDASGQQACSSDIHSEEMFAASYSECALVCVAEIHVECIHYNYLGIKSLCQLFYYKPKSLARTEGCYMLYKYGSQLNIIYTYNKILLA